MRVVILGSGAVGCLFAALLDEAGHDVALVARDSPSGNARAARLRACGLVLKRHGFDAVVLAPERLANMLVPAAEALTTCEAVIVTVKRNGNAWVGGLLRDHAPAAATVACAQNGLGQADEVLGGSAPWAGVVLDGMLSVSVNYRDDGGAAPEVVTYSPRAQERLALDGSRGAAAATVAAALQGAAFTSAAVADIGAAQRTKIILNQNNAVSALFGFSVRRAITTAATRGAASVFQDFRCPRDDATVSYFIVD